MKSFRKPILLESSQCLFHCRAVPITLPALLLVTALSTVCEASPNNEIQVVASSGFSNFERVNLKIDVPAYDMAGQYRFIKIYDDLNNTLFLGAVSPQESFTIPVHALKSATKLMVEVFSENTSDQPAVLSAQLQ
ncbi:MAG: hypothetical protein IPN42_01095 [Methylococcaceae bacterium]|nr:hypothetical protein [Methylococcaceae bacterium]